MRKTIYVPSEEIWDDVKEAAKVMNLSVSQYLLGEKKFDFKDGPKLVPDQLDRIEGKLDELLKEPRVLVEQPRMVASKGPIINAVGSEVEFLDYAILHADPVKDGQAELDESRKGRNIKKDKIAGLKATGFFQPNLKGKK